ncbi:hypothetical protein [Aquimarina algiphila]|uniref:Uncharacterized protein n=1 Tax=Aquimarina algiphila TaxID=2047982 RepID=A0A554VAF0_9FLAO|nr:hypothetical protein [Aquimarina algiphila]TSE03048.1 hypothetical protein FOF46_30145 [Aquimarina algiphila]
MKKLVLLVAVVVFGMSMGSCESNDVNEETAEFEIRKIDKEDVKPPGEKEPKYAIDKGDVISPGDKG